MGGQFGKRPIKNFEKLTFPEPYIDTETIAKLNRRLWLIISIYLTHDSLINLSTDSTMKIPY